MSKDARAVGGAVLSKYFKVGRLNKSVPFDQ